VFEITDSRDAIIALGFDLESVAGLRKVTLIGNSAVVDSKSFPAPARQAHVDFAPVANSSSWYALVVEDQEGRKAYTDPVWVDVVTAGDWLH
jgi:hypothetical protein